MATAESGGAGGKFRKKASRRSHTSTPYDRPSTALRPSQVEKNNKSWVSKLVDPASRLITVGAHKLFSSVFNKRLLPPQPPPSPDETIDTRDTQPEKIALVAPRGSKEAIVRGGNNTGRVTDCGGVAELEDILKQKTFTRSEIDHLTALLMSRTVDSLVRVEKETVEPQSSGEKAFHRRETLINLPSLDNKAEHAAISTSAVRSKVLDDDVASPADLAKAYMGSRPMRVVPSVLGIQNEILREDLSATYNSSSKPKSSSMSLIQRSASGIGASPNGFLTPRFRGRSAIYNMARTPYSRPYPAEVFKAAETVSDFYGASSSSHNATDIQQLSQSKRQVLKRRSSVLESDIGCVGPIRRIRQKPNLLHHKTLSLPASGGVHLKHGSELLTDVTEVPPLRSSTKALTDSGMPSTSNGHVPAQSTEMAEKIIQQLDLLTQKGKSPGRKIDIVEGSSSEKRKADMRDRFARKSMNNVESFRILETSEGSRKENGLLDSRNAQDYSPEVSRSVEEVGVRKFPIPSVEGGSGKGNSFKAMDNVNTRSITGQQPKKRGFQMSAHEDYLEPDDDALTNGASSTPTIKGVDSNDLAKSSAAISDDPPQNAANSAVNPIAPDPNPSTNLLAANKEVSPPDGFVASHKISGVPSLSVPSSCSATSVTSTQAAMSSPPTAEMEKAAVRNEKINEINSIDSNTAKFAPVSFSPSYSTLESAVSKDIKMALRQSESIAVAKGDEPAKSDRKNTFRFADASNKIEDSPSIPSASKGFLMFGSPLNSTTLSNGLSSSNGESSPKKNSSSSDDQTAVPVSPVFPFSNGNALSTSTVTSFAGPVISTSMTGSTATLGSSSSTQLPTSISAPPVSSGPAFQFGSSAIPSTSATPGSEALESATKSEAKLNESPFGNVSSIIPITVKPSGTASVGSDISEVTASSAFKTSGSETQTAAAPAFPMGPIFGLQASSSSGALILTQTFSTQSASSVSSSIFGLSGSSGFDASKFGNPFASITTSASSAPEASTLTAPISSSSNSMTSSTFGWSSSEPSVLSGTSSQSTGFTFGSTASGTFSAANSNSTTPTMFGASSNKLVTRSSPFIFGSTSSTSSSVFSAPFAVGSTPAATSTAFPTQSTFGISTSQPFTFGSTPPVGNTDQMSMEDSMAEDSVQVPAPSASVFAAPISGPSSFVFGGAPTPTPTLSMGSLFQFGGQQNQIGSQNTSFQPSGSFELNAGGAGSFSLGSGGGVDKSTRRMVKAKNRIRKK